MFFSKFSKFILYSFIADDEIAIMNPITTIGVIIASIKNYLRVISAKLTKRGSNATNNCSTIVTKTIPALNMICGGYSLTLLKYLHHHLIFFLLQMLLNQRQLLELLILLRIPKDALCDYQYLPLHQQLRFF